VTTGPSSRWIAGERRVHLCDMLIDPDGSPLVAVEDGHLRTRCRSGPTVRERRTVVRCSPAPICKTCFSCRLQDAGIDLMGAFAVREESR